MESRELRYRGLVYHKGQVWEVNDIFGAIGLITVLPNGKGETLGRMSVGDFDPIPITEEWLVKFGFLDCFDGSYSDDGRIKLVAEDNNWEDICLDIYVCGTYITCAQHIHQLQNLYYALTGEELTIKE